jgi:hypothetical protein
LSVSITVISLIIDSFSHIRFRLFRHQTLRTWGF